MNPLNKRFFVTVNQNFTRNMRSEVWESICNGYKNISIRTHHDILKGIGTPLNAIIGNISPSIERSVS